jgi:hypothetical protein
MATKNFFQDCQSLEAAKKLYRELLKKYHPDTGGDTETAKTVIREFAAFCAGNVESRFNTWAQERRSMGKTVSEAMNFTPFGQVLAQVALLDGDISIRLVGFWIYVYGDTRPVKEYGKAYDYHSYTDIQKPEPASKLDEARKSA